MRSMTARSSGYWPEGKPDREEDPARGTPRKTETAGIVGRTDLPPGRRQGGVSRVETSPRGTEGGNFPSGDRGGKLPLGGTEGGKKRSERDDQQDENRIPLTAAGTREPPAHSRPVAGRG